MKTTSFIVLIILVVLSVGLLLAQDTGKKAAAQTQMFTGKEDHLVDSATAVKMIKKYRANVQATTSTIKGGYFARNAFEKILAQKGCIGIRYYYAQNDTIAPVLVLVGVDSTGQDMKTGVIMEKVFPCPPYCFDASELAK